MSTDGLRDSAPFAAVPRIFAGGRYELVELIGRGGAGVTYRARDLAFFPPRAVCIKRLLDGEDGDVAAALREEARLLAGVRHANVVSLLAIGEEASGAPYLVLELVEGWNLRRLCRAVDGASCVECPGFLPDPLSVHVACALLRGLSAIQRALPGLVHRDVTPQNVLVSREGEVKLTDFGIALAEGRARWTHPSLVKGKLGYMAPEQLRGDKLDVRTDMFAVGVVLYELLARVRPWGAARGIQELRAMERGDMIPLSAHRRGPGRRAIDSALAHAVERLLRAAKEDRFGSADDALRALAPFSAGDLGALRIAYIGKGLPK
jgi:serine/threonine protein kinase